MQFPYLCTWLASDGASRMSNQRLHNYDRTSLYFNTSQIGYLFDCTLLKWKLYILMLELLLIQALEVEDELSWAFFKGNDRKNPITWNYITNWYLLKFQRYRLPIICIINRVMGTSSDCLSECELQWNN